MEEWKEVECNKRIIREVADELNQSIGLTESIIGHYSEFIAMTIRSGSLEGVFVPYLGKFQIKPRAEQYKAFIHSIGTPMRSLFLKIGDAKEILSENTPDPADVEPEDDIDEYEEL